MGPLYSNQNHLVSQDSTVSELYLGFHFFSVRWLPPLVTTTSPVFGFFYLLLARSASAGLELGCWCATTRLRIKQVDHVRQVVTVLGKQRAQRGFDNPVLLRNCTPLDHPLGFDLTSHLHRI